MCMLKIDGSYGEGGGQIIRTALALSTITGKSFEAINIRRGRDQPGLKAQHLHCIRALEELCSAKTEHSGLGSSTLKYVPGKIKNGTVKVDIGTAGSISLLLQAVLLPCLFGEGRVRLKIIGGTSGKWAMPFDYFNNLFVPFFRDNIKVKLVNRGYYPKGGGEIEITVRPGKLNKIDLIEQGKLMQIKGISHSSKILEKVNVSERQAKSARIILNSLKVPIDIRTEYCDTLSPGSGITLWGIFEENKSFIGSDGLGEKGKRAEIVGREAAENFIKELKTGCAIDSHLADNLIPLLALFSGRIKVSSITEHCRTNIWICEQFLGEIFNIDEKNSIISVKS